MSSSDKRTFLAFNKIGKEDILQKIAQHTGYMVHVYSAIICIYCFTSKNNFRLVSVKNSIERWKFLDLVISVHLTVLNVKL